MKEIYLLFEDYTKDKILGITELSSSGSNRQYLRIKGENITLIGVIGTSAQENRAFWDISKFFVANNIPAPSVLAHNEEFSCYLQEDLGDISLFDSISSGRSTGDYNEKERELLHSTVAFLPRIQFELGRNMDFSVCYPHQVFNQRLISFDLNYFKYCFLKGVGIDFDENRLEEDFNKLSAILLSSESSTFMYRDFQARNVMLRDGEPFFIDFQGGFQGPIYYDLASFVWQAKANYPDELRAEMIDTYLRAAAQYISVDRQDFLSQLRHFVLFRTLQVLGAYGFRGYFERKPHFLQSVPFAINNLRKLLKTPFAIYPYLSEILTKLTEMDKFMSQPEKKSTDKLEIRVFSFSYKRGIPEDISGNGGGYVFDCRSIDNPGRYEPYKKFTGMDKVVIDFLENDGGVFNFLDNIYPLAQAHIREYIRRKFKNLMFSFGCTGGQHRSVYCAERLADYISKNFDVRVILVHREQNVKREY